MTAAEFHALSISDIRRLTPRSVSITFDIPSDLKEAYRFTPGQYLTLKAMIGGEEVRRSYSICSSENVGSLSVGIKEVQGGRFSALANRELKIGDRMEVMTPMGSFHAPIEQGHYVALVAGSGITPVLSIIKSGLESSDNSRFTLVYGNRTADSIMFKKDIDDLVARYGDRLSVVHRLSGGEMQGAENGRIDGISLNSWNGRLFAADQVKMFFICGPEEMISSAKNVLSNMGVSKDYMKYELFTVPTTIETETISAEAEVSDFNGTSRVTVVIDEEEVAFDLDANGDSILDAGLSAGADLPFACKGGVCCTCRAKVVKGKAHMSQNFSLDDTEVEAGFILTCQSHPDTPEVVVDYDA